MTPGVITCTWCGSEVRPGSNFCPRCAGSLHRESSADAPQPNAAAVHQYTNAWDSVLTRLQGALFGEFVISRELGRGGMAAVFLAHQLRLDRKVAIKVMAPTLMSGAGLADRFRDEATTVARLDHPNIISIFEIGAAEGLQYFVMQYVPGRSLERAMRQHGRLAFDVARAITYEVGTALAHAHRNQVIHRDVKPGNILLRLDGRVMVSDFGIAKVTASSVRTQTGAVIGTPAYMSPEQCLGRALTWSADQYSLGVVAYEMVTGVTPFAGTAYAVMRGHTEDPVPPIAARRPDCPPDLAAAIERMLAKNPADRFPSMGEALSAMGASRAGIDDTVQEAIGHLAVPRPDEEGVVLVHTPASPAPQQHSAHPGSSAATGAPTPELEPSRGRALLAAAGARARHALQRGRAMAARAVHDSGTLARFVHVLLLGAARQAHESRRALGVVGAFIAIASIAATAIVMSRKSVTARVPPTAQAPRRDSSLGTASAARDSTVDTAVVSAQASDSLAGDSLAAPTDTVAANLTIRSRGSVFIGDSLQLAATVFDGQGNRLRGYRVRWRVASQLASIDSVTGLLRPRATGRVRVYARADTIEKAVWVSVTARTPAQVADGPGGRDQDQPKTPVVDEAAEAELVADVLAAFVRATLLNKNVESIRRLYQTPASSDAAARDSLIDEITSNPKLSILPPGSSPKPVFSGEAAYARTRLTMRNTRQPRKGTQAEFWIRAELRRTAGTWNVTGFRVVPPDN